MDMQPQSVCYNNNGRFMLLCGDGQYSISTTRDLRFKCFGQALEAVWSADGNGDYAVKDSTSKMKVFSGFKETITVVTPFPIEKLFGGKMLGARGANFVVFYSWKTGEVVKKIDVAAMSVYWSDDGSLLAITTEDGFYVLSADGSGDEYDFNLLNEIGDQVVSGCWSGACFIYNTEKGVKYYVGGEVIVVNHLRSHVTILGYLERENAVVIVDKDKNLSAVPLDRYLLRYQTAVLTGDFTLANSILPKIGTQELEKLSVFLQGQGFLNEAIEVTKDSMRKLDLAISLKNVELAVQILDDLDGEGEKESEKYWSQIGEICLEKGDMKTALICIEKAKDYSTMLMLASCYSNEELMKRVSDLAGDSDWNNVAFMSNFMQKNVKECVDILMRQERYPEAAFFASAYYPEMLETTVEKWKADLEKVEKEV